MFSALTWGKHKKYCICILCHTLLQTSPVFIQIFVKDIKKTTSTTTGNQLIKHWHSITALLSSSLPTKVELYIGFGHDFDSIIIPMTQAYQHTIVLNIVCNCCYADRFISRAMNSCKQTLGDVLDFSTTSQDLQTVPLKSFLF